MKRFVYYSLLLVLVLCITGCGNQDPPVPYSQGGGSDSMTVYKEWDKSFYMFRAEDYYIEFRNKDNYLTLEEMIPSNECDFPDMADGDLLRVVADVDTYYGGISGYNYSIKLRKIKSTQFIDYNDLIDELSILDVDDELINDRMNYISMHRDADTGDTYLIFPQDMSLFIYQQGDIAGSGTQFNKYPFDYDKNDDNLRSFLRTVNTPEYDLTELKENFTGKWSRTDVENTLPATITITNVGYDGFDFKGEFHWRTNEGEISGRATFNSDTEAVYTQFSDSDADGAPAYIYFNLEEGNISVGTQGFVEGLQENVFVEGNYVKGEPWYFNAEAIEETYTSEEVKMIQELLLMDYYMETFAPDTRVGNITTEEGTLEDGTHAKRFTCEVPSHPSTMGYTLIITDDGILYYKHASGRFNRNAPNYDSKELPAFTPD
ncbi:hypothetical protein SAMN02910369_01480 [Lachnospiraceae bacterium NE2001]|nr:hypothetical protein SAMN02910369_01480 [Lachnospiraceae bacterium NE2001]